FVNQFTQILVDQIRKPPAPTPFTISDLGGVSLTTSGGTGQFTIGYGQIQASTGSTAPSGLAIIGYRQNNILVSEAGVPAAPLIQSGRIFAESSGSVNTGIAIANPNSQPATVQFYFTASDGTAGSTGTVTVKANEQIAAFLDQAPFNTAKPLLGTF